MGGFPLASTERMFLYWIGGGLTRASLFSQRPERLNEQPSVLPAVEVIGPGGSYNPDFFSHQVLLKSQLVVDHRWAAENNTGVRGVFLKVVYSFWSLLLLCCLLPLVRALKPSLVALPAHSKTNKGSERRCVWRRRVIFLSIWSKVSGLCQPKHAKCANSELVPVASWAGSRKHTHRLECFRVTDAQLMRSITRDDLKKWLQFHVCTFVIGSVRQELFPVNEIKFVFVCLTLFSCYTVVLF